jgi:hypothetical protein
MAQRGALEQEETPMVTADQILAYCESEIAQRHLAADREGLRRVQLALGVLMSAAQSADDGESAKRFRNLAAKAANFQEQLEAKG